MSREIAKSTNKLTVYNITQGQNSTIKNTFINVFGNVLLCDLVIVLLFGLSCVSCIFECLRASILQIPFFYSDQTYSLMSLSNSVFFTTGIFSLFMVFYSLRYSSLKHKVVSLCLSALTIILSALFSTQLLQTDQVILVSALTIIIPIYLVSVYSKIKNNQS